MNGFKQPINLKGNQEIRVIGPRRSGKTTFMAALARSPNLGPDSPIQSVDPYDEQAETLIEMARDILEDGRELAGSDYAETTDELPNYTLLITLKPSLQNHPLAKIRGKKLMMQVSCREYAGELMKDLRNRTISHTRLNDYLTDCMSASGLLILIDGTDQKSDKEYAESLKILHKELTYRLRSNRDLTSYRIAIAFSKAEQGPVWLYRHRMQEFIDRKFPHLQDTIQKWCNNWVCQSNYFFCSAYGMKGMGDLKRPNFRARTRYSRDGVIDNPTVWRPIGLVAPLYWLQTGHDDPRLREIQD